MTAATLPLPPLSGTAPREILVVEQEPSLARMFDDVLTDAGYAVRCLPPHPAAAVLAAVAQRRPSCVLIDSGDGPVFGSSWQLAARLHAHRPELPLVLCTTDERAIAEATAQQTPRSRAAGFAGVLPQPFDLDALLGVVAGRI
jgi:CheY-like chemotaxis protein